MGWLAAALFLSGFPVLFVALKYENRGNKRKAKKIGFVGFGLITVGVIAGVLVISL